MKKASAAITALGASGNSFAAQIPLRIEIEKAITKIDFMGTSPYDDHRLRSTSAPFCACSRFASIRHWNEITLVSVLPQLREGNRRSKRLETPHQDHIAPRPAGKGQSP